VPDASFRHLLAHGVFKALLFLGAGVVIHVFHTNDMWRMGGLFRRFPWVGATFLIATLALAGVWPLPGFFTKEAILAGVFAEGLRLPFLMLALAAFLTAFYMARAVVLVFFGHPHAAAGHDDRAHPVPFLMDAVCRTLAVLTLALGLRLVFSAHHDDAPAWLPWFSLALAFGGIGLAWLVYQRRTLDPARLAAALGPIDFMARRGYGIDALYAGLYRGLLLGFSRLIGWIDRYLVDGLLNVCSALTLRGGDAARRLQTGQPQDYVYGVAVGVLVLLFCAQWLWH
jgi:NADH-quinone oxidoreductase subunit L